MKTYDDKKVYFDSQEGDFPEEEESERVQKYISGTKRSTKN